MLTLEEIGLNTWRKFFHGTEVVEAVSGIVDMAGCKVVGKHLSECGQMEEPVTLTFGPKILT